MSFVGRVVLLELLLVAVLTWMLGRSLVPEALYGVATERAIGNLDLADARLRSDLLTVRMGPTRDYDPLVSDIEAIRREGAILEGAPEGTGGRGKALATAIDAKGRMLERFEGDDATSKDALAAFDVLSARIVRARVDPDVALAVGSLASAVAHLWRQPDADAARAATSLMDALDGLDSEPGESDDAASLVRQARLLVDLLPKVDDLLERQRALSLRPITDAVSADLHRERERRRRVSSTFRWAIYGVAVTISVLLLRAGVGLRSRGQALRARVEVEAAILQASNALVACPPEEIDARLGEALAAFGAAKGADSAYMLGRDEGEARLWTRPGARGPSGWPASRQPLGRLLGGRRDRVLSGRADDATLLGPLAGVLSREGVSAIACTGFGGGAVPLGVLALERSAPVARAEDATGLGLMADLVTGALSRRDAANRRRDLEGRLRRAEKLQSLGTFASGIAHNFNNVLGVIIGQAELAAASPDAGPLTARHVREIADAGQHAREIAGRILDFGRDDRRVPEALDLGAVAAQAVGQVEAATQGRVAIAMAIASDRGRVLADHAQVLQVLVNVVQNAVQASPDRSAVSVDVRRADGGGRRLSHGGVEPGPYLRIDVRDRGRGMGADEAARMFEPFFSTRDGGTGLGLATAWHTVGAIGGGFDVTSAPGRGTNVAIWLPELAGSAEAGAGGGAVLLVGQDRAAIMRDEDLLAAIGYEPVGFTDVGAALRALGKGADRFDLAIVDRAVLRDGDASIVRSLRGALAPHRPILVSFEADDERSASDVTPEVAAVLMRPWHSGSVAATIARALRDPRPGRSIPPHPSGRSTSVEPDSAAPGHDRRGDRRGSLRTW